MDMNSGLGEGFEQAEPVFVLTEASEIDADVTISALRSHGVRAFATGSGMELWSEAGGIGQMTGVRGPFNEIRIMVHPEDLERARQVFDLATLDEEPDPPRLTSEDVSWRVDRAKRKRVLRAVALFLLVPVLLALAYEAIFALDLLAGLLD